MALWSSICVTMCAQSGQFNTSILYDGLAHTARSMGGTPLNFRSVVPPLSSTFSKNVSLTSGDMNTTFGFESVGSLSSHSAPPLLLM